MKKIPASYIICSFIIFILLAITTIYYPYLSTSDYWDHSTAVKEMSRNLLHPKDPLLGLDVQNPRYSPYIFIMAFFSGITGLDVFIVFKIFSMLNLVIFLSAFYLLTRELFGDNEKNKNLPAYCLLMALFFWAFGWNITSGYHLKLLLFVLPYPSFLSFSMSFLGLYLLLRYLREGKQVFYALVLLIGLFVLLNHFPTFTFFMSSALIITFFENEGSFKENISSFIPFSRNFRKANFLILVLPIIIFLLSFLWPYYSFYNLLFLAGSAKEFSIPFSGLFIKTGPLLLVGIPIWLSHYNDKKNKTVWWLFALNFLVFIYYYFTQKPFFERYFFYMAFYLQLIIAVKYNELNVLSIRQWRKDIKGFISRRSSFFAGKEGLRRMLRGFLAIVLLLCIAFQLALVASFYMKYDSGMIPDKVDINEYDSLKKSIGVYNIFIADGHTSLVLPMFTGKAMGHYLNHMNPFVQDYQQREAAIKMFFISGTSDAERMDMIKRYNISYIVLNSEYVNASSLPSLRNYGQTVQKTEHLEVIKLSNK